MKREEKEKNGCANEQKKTKGEESRNLAQLEIFASPPSRVFVYVSDL